MALEEYKIIHMSKSGVRYTELLHFHLYFVGFLFFACAAVLAGVRAGVCAGACV